MPSASDAPRSGPVPAPLYIDVRSFGEFAGGHLSGAVHLPLDQLQQRVAEVVPDPAQTLVLYCASGARSAFGCAVLQQMGYANVRNGGGIGQLALAEGHEIRRG